MAEHGTVSRYAQGCRCDDCHRANREYQREAQRASRDYYREHGPPAGVEHGKASTYNRYFCRCELCRRAKREWAQEVRTRLKDAPDWVAHGSVSTYNRWGCRCDACRAAASEYRRNRRPEHGPRRTRASGSSRRCTDDCPGTS